MESGSGKFHTEFLGKAVKFQHVGTVMVAHRDSETDVLQSHTLKLAQDAYAFVKSA